MTTCRNLLSVSSADCAPPAHLSIELGRDGLRTLRARNTCCRIFAVASPLRWVWKWATGLLAGRRGLGTAPSTSADCSSACCVELQELSPRPGRTTAALGLRAFRDFKAQHHSNDPTPRARGCVQHRRSSVEWPTASLRLQARRHDLCQIHETPEGVSPRGFLIVRSSRC